MKEIVTIAERLQHEITALVAKLKESYEMTAKLDELLAVFGMRPKRRGRPPKSFFGAKLRGRPGRKPKFGAIAPRPGRKPAGEDTLPSLIVKVLSRAGEPLNAKEILIRLQKIGWMTSSGDPQAMVYKTLHRIEKNGTVVKAARGQFTAPK
jgi:hypothetical protein